MPQPGDLRSAFITSTPKESVWAIPWWGRILGWVLEGWVHPWQGQLSPLIPSQRVVLGPISSSGLQGHLCLAVGLAR